MFLDIVKKHVTPTDGNNVKLLSADLLQKQEDSKHDHAEQPAQGTGPQVYQCGI